MLLSIDRSAAPMRLLSALSLFLSIAEAFRNTSPFFLVSSAPRPQSSNTHFASGASITSTTAAWLSACPVQNYIFVRQGCVATEEFDSAGASPNVRRWLRDAGEQKRWVVPQIVGAVDVEGLARGVEEGCGARRMGVDVKEGLITVEEADARVYDVEFQSLCSDEEVEFRQSHLVRSDMFLSTLVSRLPKHESYAIIYTTNPDTKGLHRQTQSEPEAPLDAYELDDLYPPGVHMDLKRDLESHTQASRGNASLPLFETYQFFTPAIFMGFTVSFALLAILYVGISAIASLEVSYFAFSKEMGPAAQRKQQ